LIWLSLAVSEIWEFKVRARTPLPSHRKREIAYKADIRGQTFTFGSEVVTCVSEDSKSVSNLTKLPVNDMDSDPNRNVGRTDLFVDFGSVPAPRETDPTPAVTRRGAEPAPPW